MVYARRVSPGLDVVRAAIGPGRPRRHGQVETRVALQDQVEQLGQRPVPLGRHVVDRPHDLADQVVDQLEAPAHLRVLEVVAELHQGDHLAGHVAVLAPARHLVVTHLGQAVGEGGRLGVLVDLALPPHGGGGAMGPPP